MQSTKLLFLEDSYAKEEDAKIVEVLPEGVVLDQTIFYYTSGGQPSDGGDISKGVNTFKVKEVRKKESKIVHFIDGEFNLCEGDAVHLKIDWERRYILMRMHTAAHILASVMFSKGKVMITGNQLGVEKTRYDFNMENFDKELLQECVDEANEVLATGHEIKIYTLPREEAFKIEGISKLANALPPNLAELRIVKIGNIDIQADGGTHVKNTQEVGKINLLKCENKGKNNRRVYFNLEN